MRKLGKFFKERREAMGLSLRDASKLSGVSHTHIRDIEDGRSIPCFEMVMRFLKAYMVDIGEFLTETGYMPPNEAGSFVLQFYSNMENLVLRARSETEGSAPEFCF